MSTLHTINKSPDSTLLASCQKFLRSGDAVLFIEDGVYHLPSLDHENLQLKGVKLYFLKEDVDARGLSTFIRKPDSFVNVAEFVELCIKHDRVSNWF